MLLLLLLLLLLLVLLLLLSLTVAILLVMEGLSSFLHTLRYVVVVAVVVLVVVVVIIVVVAVVVVVGWTSLIQIFAVLDQIVLVFSVARRRFGFMSQILFDIADSHFLCRFGSRRLR